MKKIYVLMLVCLCLIASANQKPNSGFIENKGQIHDQNFKPNTTVKYLLSIPGMNIQLKQNSFSYDTYTVEQKNTETTRETALTKLKHPAFENIYHFHRVDVEFIGANAQPEIIAEQPSETYFNYYTTGTSEQGATNVRSFEKVTYKNIYPKVDLEFIAKEGKMKYNFILHYGADINVIKWKYHGANVSEIKNSNISISVKQGEFNETIPDSYIASNSQKTKQVKIDFIKNENGVYGFASNQKITITPNQELVIDPTPSVVWATYFGGTGVDYISSSSLDNLGNVYFTGYTSSTSSIASSGAFQSSYGGGTNDVIISKFNSLGILKWATYFGRNADDQGTSIVNDDSGNVYISGVTSSIGMGSISNYQVNYGGGTYDAFLSKFDTTGNFIWFTYYGGNGFDESYGCTVDKTGNVYLSGSTTSTNSISTPGTHQLSFSGGTADVFLAKFSTTGFRLWGTYFGSTGDEGTSSCVADSIGNIYIVGYSTSTTAISTIGSHQQGQGGNYDGFLSKFNKSGILLWSTYYGGNGLDCVNNIAYDYMAKHIYVGGHSSSVDSIASVGSHQYSNNGGYDGFVAKFDTNGVRQWGTNYGGVGTDYVYDLTVDSNNVYVCGLTNSSSSIATPFAFQSAINGNYDGFIARFTKNGVRQWGTYYGGTNYDLSSSISKDNFGNIYLMGCTNSFSLATPGAYQTIHVGAAYDGYCTKFNQLAPTNVSQIFPIDSSNFTIYPNPNSGSFTLQTKEDVVIEIVNELGQIVKTIKLDGSNNHQTTITGLADGVYCLKDKLSGTVIKNKIVVVK